MQLLTEYQIQDSSQGWLERDEKEANEITQLFTRVMGQNLDDASRQDAKSSRIHRNIRKAVFVAATLTLLSIVAITVIAVSGALFPNHATLLSSSALLLPFCSLAGDYYSPLSRVAKYLGITFLTENRNRDQIFTDIAHLRRKVKNRLETMEKINGQIREMQGNAQKGQEVDLGLFQDLTKRIDSIQGQRQTLNKTIERIKGVYSSCQFDAILDPV